MEQGFRSGLLDTTIHARFRRIGFQEAFEEAQHTIAQLPGVNEGLWVLWREISPAYSIQTFARLIAIEFLSKEAVALLSRVDTSKPIYNGIALQKVRNGLTDHLGADDVLGALRAMLDLHFFDERGRPVQHYEEVRDVTRRLSTVSAQLGSTLQPNTHARFWQMSLLSEDQKEVVSLLKAFMTLKSVVMLHLRMAAHQSGRGRAELPWLDDLRSVDLTFRAVQAIWTHLPKWTQNLFYTQATAILETSDVDASIRRSIKAFLNSLPRPKQENVPHDSER